MNKKSIGILIILVVTILSVSILMNLEEENDNYIIARKPLMLVAGQNGMGLAPFMFTVDADAKFKIKAASIICVVKSAKEAADLYTKNTSGLTVV